MADEQLRANIRAVIDQADQLRNAKKEKKAQVDELLEHEALRMLQPIMQRFADEQTDAIRVRLEFLDESMKTILKRDFRVNISYSGDWYHLTLPHGE